MNQTDSIMEYLLTGAEITPLEALTKFNCLRLAARVYDLRKEGVDIDERTERRGKKYWSVYKLKGIPHG